MLLIRMHGHLPRDGRRAGAHGRDTDSVGAEVEGIGVHEACDGVADGFGVRQRLAHAHKHDVAAAGGEPLQANHLPGQRKLVWGGVGS